MKQRLIVAGVAALASGVCMHGALAAYTRMSKTNPDWPCEQILVNHLSPAAMWAGPPLTTASKTTDPKIDELASQLAQRRMPIDQAKSGIDAFAKAAGPDRKQKLMALFYALFDKLDGERSQVIAGLIRFGHRQVEQAARIRAENEKLHEEQDKYASPEEANDPSSPVSAAAKQLQWDLRIFQDRHKTLSYVCEVPVVIEQRLFALARQIQSDMN